MATHFDAHILLHAYATHRHALLYFRKHYEANAIVPARRSGHSQSLEAGQAPAPAPVPARRRTARVGRRGLLLFYFELADQRQAHFGEVRHEIERIMCLVSRARGGGHRPFALNQWGPGHFQLGQGLIGTVTLGDSFLVFLVEVTGQQTQQQR